MLRPLLVLLAFVVPAAAAPPLKFVRVSDDGTSFVTADAGRPVLLWGVNYDHDGDGRLLEDYWHQEWPTVVEDFREIKALNANCVRIHLQFGQFMNGPDEPNAENLAQLGKLIDLTEEHGLYLIITGLGCYHRAEVPTWYDALSEPDRWQAQANFWRAVARVGKRSPAVLAYDLMNEPAIPGKDQVETDWLVKPQGDKHFVQRIALDMAGRTREQVAKAWIETLAAAIREIDQQHLLTVGVIPWAHVFPKAKPLFYSPEVSGPLDFVSVHFYPKAGKVNEAIEALRVYEVGKPLVIEEIFPLHAGADEVLDFIDRSKPHADGWISFYWGETADECNQRGDMAGAITAAWLREFRAAAPK
jgi:hypothetical protein